MHQYGLNPHELNQGVWEVVAGMVVKNLEGRKVIRMVWDHPEGMVVAGAPMGGPEGMVSKHIKLGEASACVG